jgi:site-specific DNA-methyltransferase (adenine-specific)
VNEYKIDLLDLRNMDCMELMAQYPDKAFDLAIVDPPYGINVNMNMGRRAGMGKKHEAKQWDGNVPDDHYFKELFRVSQNQIIWGGNYFSLPPSRGFVIWDKMIPEALSFAMCEFAWSSFDCVSKIFRLTIQSDCANRIHPTQKSVALYKWLLANYAKEGDRILDTHLGSMSIAIACHYAGYHLTGTELDADYFREGVYRVKRETAQMTLL